MRFVRLSLLVALAAAIGGTLGAGAAVARRAARLAPDALLDDRVLPRDAELDAFVAEAALRISGRSAFLDTDPDEITTTFTDLGIELDPAATAEAARRGPRLTPFTERIRRVLTGPPREPFVVTPRYRFDVGRARHKLALLSASVHREPVDARLDLEHHQRIADTPGRDLDVEATLTRIENGPREDEATFALIYRYSPAKTQAHELPDIDVSHVLSKFQTSFAKRGGARAVNIRRGAQLLNGYVLAPDAEFSFNHVVGPRTEPRGFVSAPVIVHDEIDQGPGGGICQVASTVHAAAVYAGLEVIERRSHSRPSGYAPLGLDATVIDYKVDLRFRNPYDTPLMIHAFLPTRATIAVEILGREPPGPVVHEAQVVKRYPFLRRIVEKPDMTEGDFKRSQKGAYGYDIVSTVSFVGSDGTRTERRYRSNYYPVPEVFWVGPGTPASALPPLPEGAEGIEPEANEEP